MNLPRDPRIHATFSEYFLASHARWAVWAKQRRLEGNLESARFYAQLARQSLADWQRERGEGAMIMHWVIVGVCIAFGIALAPLALMAIYLAMGGIVLAVLFVLPFLPLVAFVAYRHGLWP